MAVSLEVVVAVVRDEDSSVSENVAAVTGEVAGTEAVEVAEGAGEDGDVVADVVATGEAVSTAGGGAGEGVVGVGVGRETYAVEAARLEERISNRSRASMESSLRKPRTTNQASQRSSSESAGLGARIAPTKTVFHRVKETRREVRLCRSFVCSGPNTALTVARPSETTISMIRLQITSTRSQRSSTAAHSV